MSDTYAIDASYVLTFLLPDEQAREADETFARYSRGECSLVSTRLLPFEVLNGLKSASAQKRLNREIAALLARDFFNLQIPLRDIDFEAALHIAHQHGLSLYDAAYVQLARGSGIPLLTMDARLQKL